MGAPALRHRLVLFSGGLDSSAVLYTSNSETTRALFVDYGQTPAPGELSAARGLATECGVDLVVANIPGLASLGAGRLSGRPPAGTADGNTELQQEEWFPARNLLLVAVAGVVLGRDGGGELCLGSSDPVYRDGQPAFYDAVHAALHEALPESASVRLVIPDRARAEILNEAIAAGLDARATFSCNRRGDRHCWRCASCRDRLVLMHELGIHP